MPGGKNFKVSGYRMHEAVDSDEYTFETLSDQNFEKKVQILFASCADIEERSFRMNNDSFRFYFSVICLDN